MQLFEQIYTSRHAIFKCYCHFLLNDRKFLCILTFYFRFYTELFLVCFCMHIYKSAIPGHWWKQYVTIFNFITIIRCYGKQSTESQRAQTWSNFDPATLPVISGGVPKFSRAFLIWFALSYISCWMIAIFSCCFYWLMFDDI